MAESGGPGGLGDSVYDELDCNDNSPRLAQFYTQNDAAQVHALPSQYQVKCGPAPPPNYCDPTSIASDNNINGQQMALPSRVTLSSEDTLNNDFFFDDEFTVPFDANLVELQGDESDGVRGCGGEALLLDSTELDDIIKNQVSRNSKKLASLKSASGSYTQDVEASMSSGLGDHHMSQELTQSEKDVASSSDMSDLPNGPIFSPPSGSINEGSASEMNSSFLNSGHKYDFDWKATKNQYTISFDKHLAKYSSDESSFCESTGPQESKVLTTWATQKVNSSDSDCQSSSSSRKSSDSATGERRRDKKPFTMHNVSLKPLQGDKEISDNGEGSGMTTWKAVRSPSHTSDDDTSPITSWKCFKRAETQQDEIQCSGDKLKTYLRQKSQTKATESGHSGSSDYKTCSEGEKARSPEVNDKQRRTSLLELFQRSKSQSGTDSSQGSEHRYDHSPCEPVCVVICDNELPMSPDAIRRLTGTWSMSTISSGRRSECAAMLSPEREDAPPNMSLKSWGTSRNLSDLPADEHRLFMSESDVSVSAHSVQSGESNLSADKAAYMPICNCDLSGCLDCSGQVGSGYLTDSYSLEKFNQSSQWPPCTCSTAIQTSLEFPSASGDSKGRSKFPAVDISSQTPPSIKHEKPYNSRVSRLYSIPAVRHSPKRARDRLSQSMFAAMRNNALPDLSFLNTNSKDTESGVLRATLSSPNLKNTKSCQTSISEHVSPTGLTKKRINKRSVSTSPCSSRESSPCISTANTTGVRRPRSNSLSTNASACSSSSSGIDPGYSSCDSQINKVAHWFGDVPEHLLPQIPEWLVHRIAYTERGLCMVCRAKVLQASATSHKNSSDSVKSSQENGTTSQPTCDKGTEDHSNGNSADHKSGKEGLEICAANGVKLRTKNSSGQGEKSGERPMSVPDMQMVFEEQAEKRRPLKSCLRRNSGDKAKIALKHRSWSDPFDATVLRYSQDGETRYQLVTVPIKPCITGELDNQIKGCAGARDSVEFHKVGTTKTPLITLAANTKCVTNNVNNITSGSLSPCSSTGQSDGSSETIVDGNKISPDKIILPPCSCGTTHAVLHSSSDSGESGTGGEHGGRGMGKKSVKFAENVFYQSPQNSPHQSPKRRSVVASEHMSGCEGATSVPLTKEMLKKMQEEYSGSPCSHMAHVKEAPVTDSMTRSGSSTSSNSVLMELDNIMAQKHGVVCAVMKACEHLELHLSEARDTSHLECLASTRDHPEVGQVILSHLCPALVTLVTDGVKPAVRSLFGKVKNTPWRLVEELVEHGAPSRVLCNLVRDLENLAFLDTPALKFNAFIFGLLNHRALDFWLTYLCNHDKVIVNHYLPTSFVALSQTSARNLFLQLNAALQPLGKIPFRLEYNFEYKLVKASQSAELSEVLLEKHTSSSTDTAVLEHLLSLQEEKLAKNEPLKPSLDAVPDHAGSIGKLDPETVHSGTSDKMARDSASPLRESIQDTLKQYTPSIEQTKERTKTLLKYTGQQIKDKFKQIQRQSRSGPENGNGSSIITEDGSPSSGARPKTNGPLRVTRYDQTKGNDTVKKSDNQGNFQKAINGMAKDDSAIKTPTVKDTIIPRSQSLDTMPGRRNTMVESNLEKSSTKQSSLSDLVNFVGKKLFSFASTSGTDSAVVPPPKPPRTYRDDVTKYSFEHNTSLVSSSSESCLSNLGNAIEPQVSSTGHNRTTSIGGFKRNEVLMKSNSLSSLQQSSSSCSSAPPSDFQIPGSNNTSVFSSTHCASHGTETKNIPTAKICSPSASMQANEDQNQPSQSMSKTASFFRKKLGPALINVFDKLLLDKKPAAAAVTPVVSEGSGMKKTRSEMVIGSGCHTENSEVAGTVRRSVSQQEMPSRQIQALCTYVANESDQLSFQKGSLLSLIREVDTEWVMCEHKDMQGLVHRGCVQGIEQPK